MTAKLLISILCLIVQPAIAQLQSKSHITATGNLGPGCNILLKIPKTGRFSITHTKEKNSGGGTLTMQSSGPIKKTWFFSFRCYNSQNEVVNNGWAILKGGEWQAKIEDSVQQLINFNAFSFYQLSSVNASGWAITEDDISGDERFRRRNMTYCLIKDQNAVCGEGLMGYLHNFAQNRHADLTPYALNLLRSIEFLVDVPESGGNP